MGHTNRQADGVLDEGRLEAGGDFDGAVRAYQQVLSMVPDDGQALHRLGVAAYRAGHLDQAENLIRRAIGRDPDCSACHKALGNVYKRQGRLSLAKASLRRAVSLAPDSAAAHYDLGIVHHISGRLQQALERYRSAVGCDPEHALAWNNMGLVYLAQGARDQAIDCFETAIAKKPDFAGAYTNLGSVFVETEQFRKSVDLNRTAIALDPHNYTAFHNMGNALLKQDLYRQAIACFQKGLSKNPDHPEMLNSLGVAYQKNGQPEQAITCFQNVIIQKPDAQKSVIHLYNQLRQVCDWHQADRITRIIDRFTQASLQSNAIPAEPPFMSVCRDMDEERHFQIARLWGRDLEEQAGLKKKTAHFAFHRQPRRKLHIGYLTNNFRNHPTTHLLFRLFGMHNRDRFRVVAYSCSRRSSHAYAQVVQNNCDAFKTLFMKSDRNAAEIIYEDGIDILVDLNGYTDGHRMQIGAWRPAPVQVRYLGMAGTSGVSFFDYLIGDHIVLPQTADRFYTEKFVHMPHTYQVNSYGDDSDPMSRQTILAKPADTPFTFCCFCSNYKLGADLFNTWMRILKRVPGSILWLLGESRSVSRWLRQAAMVQDIDPDRLRFAEKQPKDKHLSRLQEADLALDTRVVNGAATTSDALWAGVPVITIRGRHFASRMSASILTAVGLPELITSDLRAYEDLAVALATDSAKLDRIRGKLEENKHSQPLFDTRRFVRNLENAFEQMWAIYMAGEQPRHITVQDCG